MTLSDIIEEKGWDDETVVQLLFEFIAEQGLMTELEVFLEKRAEQDV